MNSATETKTDTTSSKLVLAAERVFERDGGFPINFADVSHQADVSRALVYANFPTPQDLVNAMLARQVCILEQSDIHSAISQPDFRSATLAALVVYCDHLIDHGPILHMASQDTYMRGHLAPDYVRFRNRMLVSLSRKARHELALPASLSLALVILLASLAEEAARMARSERVDAELAKEVMRNSAELMIDGITPSSDLPAKTSSTASLAV